MFRAKPKLSSRSCSLDETCFDVIRATMFLSAASKSAIFLRLSGLIISRSDASRHGRHTSKTTGLHVIGWKCLGYATPTAPVPKRIHEAPRKRQQRQSRQWPGLRRASAYHSAPSCGTCDEFCHFVAYHGCDYDFRKSDFPQTRFSALASQATIQIGPSQSQMV